VNNWKDISTAPKDRKILIAGKHGGIFIGIWALDRVNISGKKETLYKYVIDGKVSDCYVTAPYAWHELPKMERIRDGA
jgi:hypothetical protein